jgi:hypothetical protein
MITHSGKYGFSPAGRGRLLICEQAKDAAITIIHAMHERRNPEYGFLSLHDGLFDERSIPIKPFQCGCEKRCIVHGLSESTSQYLAETGWKLPSPTFLVAANLIA